MKGAGADRGRAPTEVSTISSTESPSQSSPSRPPWLTTMLACVTEKAAYRFVASHARRTVAELSDPPDGGSSTIAGAPAPARRGPRDSRSQGTARLAGRATSGLRRAPISQRSGLWLREVARSRSGPRLVWLAVVAQPLGKDRLQLGDLIRVGYPWRVSTIHHRRVDRLAATAVDAAFDGRAGDDAGSAVQRERLRARPRRASVEDAFPNAIAGVHQLAVAIVAGVHRLRGLVGRNARATVGTDVHEPLVHHRQRFEALARLGRVRDGVGEPDHEVVAVAHPLQHALARSEALMRVVHVELPLHVLAVVDCRHVEPAAEDVAAGVRGAHRYRIPLGARRRLRRVGAQVHVLAAPRVEVARDGQRLVDLALARAEEREGLLHHLARVLPASDVPVDVQELGGCDLTALQRREAILHADVVPGGARGARGIDAVDVAQIVVVRPPDGEDVGERLP